MKVTIDGKEYEVLHQFSESRVIIDFDSAPVFADRWADGGGWDLSGEPARENEKPIYEALVAPMLDKTVVTVTKDDE